MPQTTVLDVHALLLALAGRAPDGWLAVARDSLADGDHDHVTRMIATIAGQGLAFTEDEAATVSAILGEDVPAAADAVAAPPAFTAAPGPLAAEAATALAASGVVAVWRAARADGVTVHLAETAAHADPVAATRALARALGADTVEVFAPDATLPPYHEAAVDAGTLVHVDAAGPVRVARVFDGVDPDAGPYFVTDRERVDDERRERLLDYLRGAETVLDVDGELADVLDPGATTSAAFRSDGTWAWNDATVHYLDRHAIAPDPELAAHVDERTAAADTGPRLTAIGAPSRLRRSDRARVRAALAAGPADDAPLWRAG